LMMGPIEAGTSGRASIVAKTAVSRFAIVLPPAETDVPDPVRTTRFFHPQPFGDQSLETNAPLILVEAKQKIAGVAVFRQANELILDRYRPRSRYYPILPPPSRGAADS
jgi:hypothetical protein